MASWPKQVSTSNCPGKVNAPRKRHSKAEIAADKVAIQAIQAEKITAAAEHHNSAIQ
jgi:hypothetical protein